MKKIPVRILEITSPGGHTKKAAAIDSKYYFQMKEGTIKKIQKFESLYFKTLKKAKEIFPEYKKSRNSFDYWNLGNLLFKFNMSIENDFLITNYTTAILRDFGLYERSMVGALLQLGSFFDKNEINPKISLSHYIELTSKANQLKKINKFDSEKKRLQHMHELNIIPTHKNYRNELKQIINNGI